MRSEFYVSPETLVNSLNVTEEMLDQEINYLEGKGFVEIVGGRYCGKKYLNFPGVKLTASGIDKVEEENNEIDNISTVGQRVQIYKKYDFHPAIKKVSYSQFKDGYYKESIQNALVEVIDRVKKESGNPKENGRELDGDRLMNKAFGCENQEPIIKLNSLSDSLDKDEQKGFMNIFKGIVGIRNKKAHLNFIQNDPLKTIEYLSLASLLMRLLDEYRIYE
jgi:uncharacterized protein (TIGR02391 family)